MRIFGVWLDWLEWNRVLACWANLGSCRSVQEASDPWFSILWVLAI